MDPLELFNRNFPLALYAYRKFCSRHRLPYHPMFKGASMQGLWHACTHVNWSFQHPFQNYAGVCIDWFLITCLKKEWESPGRWKTNQPDWFWDNTPDPFLVEEPFEEEWTTNFMERIRKRLCPRLWMILTLKYGLDGNRTHTHREIGKILCISYQRVSELRVQAEQKIRGYASHLYHQLTDYDRGCSLSGHRRGKIKTDDDSMDRVFRLLENSEME